MHAIWKGSLSFGLINIPIQVYTAKQEKDISFVMMHKKDNSQIRYARICKTEEKEIPWNEIVKAYEYEKGKFVLIDDEDFEKANLKKSKTIEIICFIDEEEVDSVYYVKPYFMEPQKNSEKTYHLLKEAIKKSKKVGLARFVLRNREHLAILKVHGNMLILNELRYQKELVRAEDLNIPQLEKTNPHELEIAVQLINQLTEPFNPEDYKDNYIEEMKKIIKQKAKGNLIYSKEEKIKSTKIHDIMGLLKASLKNKKKPAKKSRKTA